jgi:hypothetical protein
MTTEIKGWVLVDEPIHVPMATERGHAWVWVETTTQGTDVILRLCTDQDRANVPVEVLEALLAAWRARQPVP